LRKTTIKIDIGSPINYKLGTCLQHLQHQKQIFENSVEYKYGNTQAPIYTMTTKPLLEKVVY